MRKPILYLDIDGTLLHADQSRWGYGVAPGAIEFLEWAVAHFEVRWLSTRCREGDARQLVDYVEAKLHAHDVGKLVPETSVLKDHAWRLIEQTLTAQRLQTMWADIVKAAGAYNLPRNLSQRTAARLKREPALSWDAALAQEIESLLKD